MQINPRNGRFYAVFRGFLHPAGVCRARRAAAVVGRSWASWARKRTPTAADAHNLKIVVKLRAVPASKVPFPVGIAGFPDFSRPVPVYPAFLKYVVPVQLPTSWRFFLRAYTTHEQTYSVWAAPTWPVKLCLFIGLALLAIQSVSEILKQVQAIVELAQGKKNLPADGKEAQ